VVNKIDKAHATFLELEKLLPGKVAIWTSEHDPSCRKKDEVRRVPRAKLPKQLFTKDDLQDYPVAIVTHAMYAHAESHKARQVLGRNGQLQPRAFTAIDEKIEDVAIFDITLSDAEKVREDVWADPQHAQAIGPHIEALCRFMRAHSHQGRSLETPDDESELAAELAFFTTDPAFDYARHRSGAASAVGSVFGFARALAGGYAFVVRPAPGTTRSIGYENNFAIAPGTMLLDATADLDGIVR
jgi:hypothetical protein